MNEVPRSQTVTDTNSNIAYCNRGRDGVLVDKMYLSLI